MSRFLGRALLVGLLLGSVSLSDSAAEGLSFRGWGPRAGISANPDQVFGGAHFDLGEIVENLRLQPNVELGFGDDVTLLSGNIAALWLFEGDWQGWRPYAGGEIGLAYADYDHDRRHGNDTDTDIVLNAVGGLETKLKSDTRMFFELKLGIVEEPDLKLLIGWTF